MKNKKLLNILKKFNFHKNIESISEKILKKFIIIVKTKKKKSTKYLIKVCMSNFASKLNINEENGYHFFKNKKIYKIKYPKYKKILKTEKFSVDKIEFITGTKLNYTDFLKLKSFYYKCISESKKINLDKYFSIINNNFKKLYSFNISKDLNKDYKKILEKFKGGIYVSFSHGDFVPWNVIRDKNNNIFLYDFEYFSKQRIYIYDLIYWLISPIFSKFRFLLNIEINYNFFFIVYLNLVLKRLGIFINKNDLIKYFALYLLEQKYFYKLPNKFKNKKSLYTASDINKSKLLSSCYSKQLDMILKKN